MRFPRETELDETLPMPPGFVRLALRVEGPDTVAKEVTVLIAESELTATPLTDLVERYLRPMASAIQHASR